MALGHALLHPERVRRAAAAGSSDDIYGASVDVGLGLFGFGDPGPAAAAWAEGLGQRAKPLVDTFARIGNEGPFAAFFQAPAADISGLQAQLGGLIDAAAALDADGLRRRLEAVADAVLGALPELRLPDLAGMVNREADAALGILEAPLLGGRRDAAAHRAFRTAAEIRRRLRDLALPLPPVVAGLDLKAMLRARLSAIFARLEAPALAAFATQIGALKGEFGALFGALGRLSVSVSVDVQVGGPQPMSAAVPGVEDEGKAAPFPRGHALWWLDLVTGVVAVFNLIWEMVRTSNFSGRGFDGFVSVLLAVWQTTRVVMRATIPDQMGEWSSGSQWLFTDQGDFVLSYFVRFLACFYEVGSDTNWVGAMLIRGLKHVTAVSQPRAIYQFARSIWYLEEWKKKNDEDKAAGRPEAEWTRPSFLRATWAAWGPMWFAGFIGGLIPFWEDFRLEGLEASAIVPMVIFGVAALAVCIVMLAQQFRGVPTAEDHASRGFIIGAFVLVMVLVIILLAGLESDSQVGAAVALGVIGTLVLATIILAWVPQTASWASYLLIALVGLVVAFAIPFVLWWDYIDDGRDKNDDFDGLDADTSPYRLPFSAGENWMCSQGTHGIFSHHTRKGTTNHYAFDFNEVEGSVVRAGRDGVISELQELFENRKQDPNFLHILHTSWVQGHDPGTDDERVLTFGNYFHLMQDGVLPVLGQNVRRGEDIARLDSTGRSAQQHIHIATEEQQRGSAEGLPFVFGDDNAKGFRHYPLLAWVPGKGPIPGKPVSYAFYKSQNAAPAGGPAAMDMELALQIGGVDDHQHRLFLPAAEVGGAADPVELFAEVSRGHTHRVLVSRAAINALRSPSPGGGDITVEPGPDGHVHVAGRRALRTVRFSLAEGISTTDGAHSHTVDVNQRDYLAGVPAAAVTVNSSTFESHSHPVDFQPAAIRAVLLDQVPDAADVTVQSADGHTHGPLSAAPAPDQSLGGVSAALVAPPRARLAAEAPGPYRLFGGQAILRVNERVSEAWNFGAHRPQVAPDVPAERGLATAEAVTVSGAGIAPAGDTRGSPRMAAAALTVALRAAGGALGHAAVVAVPAIVVETRTRGGAARLRRAAGSAAVFGAAAGPESRGAGDVADIAALTPAVLAAHIQSVLQTGWPAPPVPVGGAFLPGGPAPDLAISAPRTAAVLGLAASPLDGAIATARALPLQSGWVGVTGGWAVPVLAAPAVAALDLAHPAMAGAQRAGSVLEVEVCGTTQAVAFSAADGDAQAVARRIMLAADGVRAWAEGAGTVMVATLAGGSTVTLALRKEPGLAVASVAGASAALAAGGPVRDSFAVTRDVLRDVVADAAGRATLPYDPAVVLPQASVQGGRLRLEVAAGNTIQILAQPVPVAPGGAPAAQQWESDPLPAQIRVAGSTWIDVELAGSVVRVPLTGEPARLEIGPLPALPVAGDRLELEVDGVAVPVVFDGTEGSVAGVAARIAEASAALTVRFAWRMVLAGTLHGAGRGPDPLTLADSAGLAVLGFLRDPAGLRDVPQGLVGDAMAAGPGGPIDSGAPAIGWRVRGPRSARLAAPGGGAARLESDPADVLTVAAPAAGDPLGFVAAGNAVAVGAALPVALGPGVATWTFAAAQGGVAQAMAVGQLAAMPAALRGRAAPEAQGDVALPLVVTVTGPGGALPPATVDLAGFASAEAAAAMLASVPGVIAFPVTAGAQTVVHAETLGRGTGWRLRLEGAAALAALGLVRPDLVPGASVLEAQGGGTVADGAAVTDAEVRAMLVRAAASAVQPEPDPPPLYAVASPGALELAPGVAGAPLPTLASDPPGYAATLGAVAGPAVLSIPAGTTRPLGALLRVTAGPRRTTVPLIGSPAELRGPDPLPAEGSAAATEQLAYLAANGVGVRVDGTLRAVPPSPTPFASLDAAVEWIAAAILPGWAGVEGVAATAAAGPGGGGGGVPDPVANRHLVLRSLRRGTAAAIALEFPPAAPPASGLLGFAANVAATGRGTVPDSDALAVTGGAGTLQRALADRDDLPDSDQALFRAVADDVAGTVRLVPTATAGVIALPGGLPAEIAAVETAGTVLLTTGPALFLEARTVTIGVRVPGADPATVRSALWSTPARLPPLVLPNSLAVLDGLTLEFLLDGAALTVTLGNAANGNALAAQIARGSRWRLRAFLRAGQLVLETVREGSAVALSLTGGTAVTDDVATGFTAPARPVAAQGAGSLADAGAATPTMIAAALEAGWLEEGAALDGVDVANQVIDRRTYRLDAPVGRAWVLNSLRPGVAGRLEWLAQATVASDPVWNDSLSRGAAVRAAVALPAIAGTVSPNGRVAIRLDDNVGPGLPVAHAVEVVFDGAALDAAAVAARIDAVLRAAGAGAAAVWPDGTVVVETAYPGLAGSIEIPAPGDRGAADALVGAGAVLRARGWPGGGRSDPFRAMPNGWRAVRTAAGGAATYEFRADGRSTGPVAIAPGMDAAAAALALNAAFDGTAAGGALRIGLAGVVDGALCVEAVVSPMSLLVDGDLSVATEPGKAGQTPEPPADAAFDLRRTDLIRTVRLVRGATDDAGFADAEDFGWLRHPMQRVDPEPPDPPTGDPLPDPSIRSANFPAFPRGRWLASVRSDAARAANAADAAALRSATAMVALLRPPAVAGAPPVPLMLRHWATFNGSDGQIGGSAAGPEDFMVDLLTWR